MAKKYTHVQPKVHPLTISIIIGFIVVAIGLIVVLQPSDKQLIYNAYEAYATDDLTLDHPFVSKNYDSTLFKKGLDKLIEQEEIVIVYIGSPSCTSCQAHIGAFQKYYESLNLDEYVDMIYYFNPLDHATGFKNFMADFEEVEETTPQLIVFKDGKVFDQFEVQSGDDNQIINRSVRNFYEDVIDQLED